MNQKNIVKDIQSKLFDLGYKVSGFSCEAYADGE